MKRTRNLLGTGLTLGFVVALQSGCAGTATMAKPAAKQETGPQSAAKPADESEQQILSGKVMETVSSGGYTYIKLEKDGRSNWVALPLMVAKVGQELKVRPGMEMGKFTSNSLKRTFDGIIFSAGLAASPSAQAAPTGLPLVSPDAPLPNGHPPIDRSIKPPGNPPMAAQDKQAVPSATINGKVVETMDSGGYTYVNLEKDGKKCWVAIPVEEVKVGQELAVANGAVMTNFKSKALNRTFESVVFSSGLAK